MFLSVLEAKLTDEMGDCYNSISIAMCFSTCTERRIVVGQVAGDDL
jgi:hypothetical protein